MIGAVDLAPAKGYAGPLRNIFHEWNVVTDGSV